MLGFLRAKPKPDREALLSAVPVRNERVEETRTDAGLLRLKAPLRPTLVKRLFGSTASTKTFELDELGAAVWEAVDGKRNIERIITDFARQQRVNLREAEVSVLAFLKTLVQRGLIALVAREEKKKRKR